MYHTDYSNKLRNASRKSAKKLPRTVTFTPIIEDHTTHLHRAVVAVVLVIVAILQMDPANAQPTMDVAGYGTLQLVNTKQPIRAIAVNNKLDMVIEDDQLGLTIKQTFINQTSQQRHGEYWFALPAHANIKSWQAKFETCLARHYSLKLNCENYIKRVHSDSDFLFARMKNQLLIKIPALSPKQQVSIHLSIVYPNNSSVFASEIPNPPREYDSDQEVVHRIAAGTDALGSVSTTYPKRFLRTER